jgi:hypothetical protein
MNYSHNDDKENDGFLSNTTTAVPTTSVTLSGDISYNNNNNNNNSSFDYRFIFYFGLITFIIVLSFCLYRRHCPCWEVVARRYRPTTSTTSTTYLQHQQLPAALTFQQMQLLQQHQSHPFQHGLYLVSTLPHSQQDLLLRRPAQDSLNRDTVMAERLRRLDESLNETTFVVQEGDVIVVPQGEGGGGDVTAHLITVPAATTSNIPRSLQDMEEAVLADLDVTSVLQLPKQGQAGKQEYINACRTVPGVCAICLCGYRVGDRVTWSTQWECQHAFHHECIVPWLAKNYESDSKCPCCRQVYCSIRPVLLRGLMHPDCQNQPI